MSTGIPKIMNFETKPFYWPHGASPRRVYPSATRSQNYDSVKRHRIQRRLCRPRRPTRRIQNPRRRVGVVRREQTLRILRRELRDAGCFEPVLWRQIGYMIFVVLAFGIGYITLLGDAAMVPRLAALLLIAAANVHAGFIAHEIGHGAVTRNRRAAGVTGLTHSKNQKAKK